MCRGAPGLNRRTKYQRVGAPGKPGIVGCSVTLGNLGAVGSQGAVGNPGAVGSSGAVGNPGAVGIFGIQSGVVTNKGSCPGWKPCNLERYRSWNKYSISLGFVDKSCSDYIIYIVSSVESMFLVLQGTPGPFEVYVNN